VSWNGRRDIDQARRWHRTRQFRRWLARTQAYVWTLRRSEASDEQMWRGASSQLPAAAAAAAAALYGAARWLTRSRTERAIAINSTQRPTGPPARLRASSHARQCRDLRTQSAQYRIAVSLGCRRGTARRSVPLGDFGHVR